VNSTIKRPIKRSLIIGSIIFALVLCLALGVISYSDYSQILYEQYQESITNLLNYAESHIDAEDLKECIDTGVNRNNTINCRLFSTI